MRRTALLVALCGALAPAPAVAHSIPYRDAFQAAQAAVSGAAWDVGSGRWRVAWCERSNAHRWRCSGNVDVHDRAGWTITCARPTSNPTIPEGRVRT